MRFESARRGQQGIIGTVILIGLVLAGVLFVTIMGSGLLTTIQEDTTDQSATGVFQQVDTELSSVTRSTGEVEQSLSFGNLAPGSTRIKEGTGTLKLTAVRWQDESARNTVLCENTEEVSLNTMLYETSDGNTVAYQAGGIWQANRDGGSGMISEPDVSFNGGRIQVEVTNPKGGVTNADPTATLAKKETLGSSLFTGDCKRPHAVRVTVESDYHEAWSKYLASEFGTDATRPAGTDRTVRVSVDDGRLARIADDDRNDVIDLDSSANFMSSVAIGGSPPNQIRVSKSAHTGTYDTTVEPIASGSASGDLGISDPETVKTTTDERQGLDVVFVVDESGSMSDNANQGTPPCGGSTDNLVDWRDNTCQSKATAAREAIRRAVNNELDPAVDEVGLVGFYPGVNVRPDPDAGTFVDAVKTTKGARIFRTNGQGLTSDFDAFVGTSTGDSYASFDGTTLGKTNAAAQTNAAAGLRKANMLLQTEGDPEDEDVIVLLSDGRNTVGDVTYDGVTKSDDEWTRYFSERAENEQRINIYSVGLGFRPALDEALLREVANHNHPRGVSDANDDYFYAQNGDELVGAFQTIVSRATKSKRLRRIPISTSLSGATVDRPTIPGDTSSIDTENGYLNVNDPAAPLLFRHTFGVTDGTPLTFETFTYGCNNYEPTDIFQANAGTEYRVYRCTDIGNRQEVIGDEASEVEIYTDGDTISSLDSSSLEWWQDDLRSAIEDAEGIDIDESSDQLETNSNQALVVLTIERGGVTNKLALLAEVGQSREETVAQDVLDFQVSTVEIDG